MRTTSDNQKKKKLTIAERRKKVSKLLVEGWTFEQIVDYFETNLGYKTSTSTIGRDAQYLAEKADKEAINEYITHRKIKLDQLAAQRKVLAHQVLVEKDHSAHKIWNDLTTQECKILGLYAPIQVQVQQQVESTLDEFIQFLEANISTAAFDEVMAALQANAEAQEKAAVN